MESKINIIYPLKVTFIDYISNEDWAVLIQLVGCDNDCIDCQNKELQNKDYDIDILKMSPQEIINELNTAKLIGCDKIKVVLSGGDPLYKYNIDWTRELLKLSSKEFDYCIYTGYNIDYVKKNNINGFKFIKTGKYDKNNKNVTEKTDNNFVLASTNQQIYNEKFELLTNNGVLNFN
jgi:anaerobic ribonucleoside-triphosphate reductase activating protein